MPSLFVCDGVWVKQLHHCEQPTVYLIARFIFFCQFVKYFHCYFVTILFYNLGSHLITLSERQIIVSNVCIIFIVFKRIISEVYLCEWVLVFLRLRLLLIVASAV